MNNQNRIDELEELITRYRESYYNGDPEISDEAFDNLEDELRDLQPDSSVLSDVGSPTPAKTKWKKKSHVIPMGSLNKANSIQDTLDWFSNSRSVLGHRSTDSLKEDDSLFWSEKLDGISIALEYEKGKLVSAVTRGDGFMGEDIIANVVLMRGVPRHIDPPTPQSKPITGVFRGEIVLTHDWFQLHFEDYSNPRNAASGQAKVEDREKAKRCAYLTVYVYEAFIDGYQFENMTEKFMFIDDCDLMIPNHGGPSSLKTIEEHYINYESHFRDELFYDIDGLVIRYHKQKDYERAGDRNNRPHGAVALKFTAESDTTTLRDVKWQVGNTGRVTPVAEFDPIELAGAEVQRSSLYNISYIHELGLNLEDEILVKRANDVIPRVVEVVVKNSDGILEVPTHCPCCSDTLHMDGEYLVCLNSMCPAQVAGTLKSWVESLDLLDWGDFVLEELVAQNLVTTPSDLYKLKVDDIATLTNTGGARVGEKTANKLLDKLHANTEITLDQFLGGLNIPLCRDRSFRKAMKGGFDTLDKIVNATANEIASSSEGLGPKKADAMVEGLQKLSPVINELLEHLTIIDKGGPLKGKSFCITGSLSRSRKVIEKAIKDSGGDVKKGVSQSLTYLVCNDKESNSSKAKKARKYEIPLISEDELNQMMS